MPFGFVGFSVQFRPLVVLLWQPTTKATQEKSTHLVSVPPTGPLIVGSGEFSDWFEMSSSLMSSLVVDDSNLWQRAVGQVESGTNRR